MGDGTDVQIDKLCTYVRDCGENNVTAPSRGLKIICQRMCNSLQSPLATPCRKRTCHIYYTEFYSKEI